jgi:DNA-binding transcriptional regulator YdaS (Cro superfamily)
LNSTQYRTSVAALGLTLAGAARLLGVDERTSRRWASGEREVPETVARFLSFLISADIKPDEVMRALAPPA